MIYYKYIKEAKEKRQKEQIMKKFKILEKVFVEGHAKSAWEGVVTPSDLWQKAYLMRLLNF